jgi:hypothetical protein
VARGAGACAWGGCDCWAAAEREGRAGPAAGVERGPDCRQQVIRARAGVWPGWQLPCPPICVAAPRGPHHDVEDERGLASAAACSSRGGGVQRLRARGGERDRGEPASSRARHPADTSGMRHGTGGAMRGRTARGAAAAMDGGGAPRRRPTRRRPGGSPYGKGAPPPQRGTLHVPLVGERAWLARQAPADGLRRSGRPRQACGLRWWSGSAQVKKSSCLFNRRPKSRGA